ncbi:hypothetical protein [Streptacidiphilus cavernicola]|uniref:Transmembrane protein n=1 Tax=Streptacidiphilus cavernicola TaxID=3342716 RepID=A0ABV6VUN6_9ACTN
MYWWLNLIELVTWVLFTGGLLSALVAIGLHPTSWKMLAAYVGYMCVMAWVRSVHYLRGAITVGFFDRMFTFFCAPLYALMNLCLLLPLRLWSLATLRSTNWGTRATVEVGGGEEPQTVGADDDVPGSAAIPAGGRWEETLPLRVVRQQRPEQAFPVPVGAYGSPTDQADPTGHQSRTGYDPYFPAPDGSPTSR